MFYERLTKLCKERQTSLTFVLKDLNLSTGSTGRWKKGSIPNGETLAILAEYLNTTVDFLLGKTEQKNKPSTAEANRELSKDEEEFILAYRSLTKEQKEIYLRAVGLDPAILDKD